jgi:hypothetical protein
MMIFVPVLTAPPRAEGCEKMQVLPVLRQHQDRYFSQGRPTKLVRDGEVECFDEPPAGPVPAGELVSAEQPCLGAADGSDLRRADRPSGQYDREKALTEVFGMSW